MNSIKKGVEITIGDKTYLMRFNTNACVNFEEVSGKTLFQVMDGTMPGIKVIRALLWAGLNNGVQKYSLEQVGDIIDTAEGGAAAILDKIQESIIASLPKMENPPENEEGETDIPLAVKNPSPQ